MNLTINKTINIDKMKKLFLIIFLLTSLSSCLSSLNKERVKSIESIAASSRINSSEQNSKSTFDELE